MTELLTLENLLNLGVLLFLQAVLGFDNLLYISIESQRAPAGTEARVRRAGIMLAVALRVVLLFVMMQAIERLATPFFHFRWAGVLTGAVNFSTVVFVFGGGFIMYTAVKEIHHLIAVEDITATGSKAPKSQFQVIALIVLMNLIFSFDSILSALAITDVFPLLAFAIVGAGIAMLVFADHVAEFIQRNRKYEVLGLFILLIVGVVLLGESGVAAAHVTHDAEDAIRVFGYPIEPMSKSTFYFALVVLVVVDVLQTRFQRKLAQLRQP